MSPGFKDKSGASPLPISPTSALSRSWLPSWSRVTTVLFGSAMRVVPPALAIAAMMVILSSNGYGPGFFTCPKTYTLRNQPFIKTDTCASCRIQSYNRQHFPSLLRGKALNYDRANQWQTNRTIRADLMDTAQLRFVIHSNFDYIPSP